MAQRYPEHRVRCPVFCSSWLDLTFIHWRVDPKRIQGLLPPGLAVDERDGAAWVGLTPFVLANVRPPLPGITRVQRGWSGPEVNVRTYVRGPDGRDGLWFFSLDIANPLVPMASRVAVGVPYFWADQSVERSGHEVRYRGSRRRVGISHDITVRVGPENTPEPLTDWLTGRWRAYTHHLGRLVVVPVEHEPWPLRKACLSGFSEGLTAAAGLPDLGDPELVHFSHGVRMVRTGRPRLVK